MPTLKNAFLALAALILLAVASVATAIASGWTRRFDAPYPAVTASADPAVLAQGRYLAYGPAACAYCHVPRDRWNELARGVELPLTGGHEFPLPFGDVYSANLTADQETGIGRRTDGELARILRHGVRADGHAAVPLMAYQGMSDEDLVAVISFVRSQGPVVNRVPANRLTALGKALMAFVITPGSPAAPPPATSPAGPSVERGEYLAVKIASCVECHTNRDDRGALVGPHFAGGQRMEVANDAVEGVRHAEPHPGRRDERDRTLDRGRLRAAVQAGRDRARHADAVGRVRPDDRRRPAQRLPVPAEPAAGVERHWPPRPAQRVASP